MRHEIFWFFFFFFWGRGDGKFRIHDLLQKLGFNFNWAVSAASHSLWIFFILLQMRNQRSEHDWKRRAPREICESHSQEIWKDEGKIKTETRLRNFKSQITPLPLFYPLWWNWLVYSHSSKAWISNPKSMEKKELFWSIWTFPAWLQGCSQFANTTAFLGNKYLTAVGSASDKFHFGKQIPL